MKRPVLLLLVLAAFPLVAAEKAPEAAPRDPNVAATENWPRWRGPLDLGSVSVGSYPAEWAAPDGKNILWSAKLPGIGCSTPAVWNDHILITCPVDGQDALLSFDWQGQVRWKTQVGPQKAGKHRNGSGANSSPVTDGKNIFGYFKSGNLAGFDFAGKLLWKTNLQERFAKDTLFWDIGTSPVLTSNLVVVAVMHSGESYLAAFDKLSGDLKWRALRNYETPVEGDHSYATPLLVQHEGKEALVVWGAERVTCHSVEDGRILWSCEGFNPDKKGFWVVVASAIIADDVLIVPYGRGTHLAGVKLGGSGDVTATHKLWTRTDTGVFVPSPVVHQGKVYLVRDDGQVECLDPKTGQTIWTDRFPKHRMKYYASPVIADGKIFAPREDGVVLVGKIDGKFEVLAENDMAQRIIASPVPVNNRLLIRGEENLFCISAK